MNGDRPVTQAQLVAELKATRAELRQEMGDMRAELRQEMGDMRAELKQEIAGVRTELVGAIHHVVETLGTRMDRMHEELVTMRREMVTRSELETMHADLARQIAGAARAAAEENRREIGIVDDKVRDLPGRVTVLERELDEHRRDTSLHPRRRR